MASFRAAAERYRVGIVVICMMGLVFIGGCGVREMASVWRDRDVVINGKDEGFEWNQAKYYYQDENITLGLLNDNDFLYIRLSTGDTARQQQVLRQGLTIWFDSACGKNKVQGIRYPRGGGMMMRMGGGGMGAGGARAGQAPAAGAIAGQQSSAGNEEIELIGFTDSDTAAMSLGAADSLGFTASLNNASGVLTYELKVPLSACKQVTQESDSEPGTMYLCFDVSNQAAATPPASTGGAPGGRAGGAPVGGMGGGMGGGGRGGGRGGMGGMGGGMGAPGAGAGMPAPAATPQGMELWLKVTLASANTVQ